MQMWSRACSRIVKGFIMSAAASLAKSGKLILVISIVVFIAALVVLLMTAGLGNATQAPEARLPVAVSTGTIKIQSGFETPINVFGLVESPKAASLSFDVAGQVTTLLVEEGDVVSQGDILARQDLQRLNARKRELQASLERANADLALTQVNSDRSRLESKNYFKQS